MRCWISTGWIAALGALCAACSTAPPPQPEAPPPREPRHKMVNPLEDPADVDDGMEVQGMLGTLDQDAIQAGLSPRLPRVTRCFDERLRRQPYLCGEVALRFRVARDGSIKQVGIARSTLGSFEAERCILAAVRGARFERPRGGEAEFQYPLSFQGRLNVYGWESGMVSRELQEHSEQLLSVKRGRSTIVLDAPRGLELTFYVDRRGKAISVGMTAEEAIEEAFALPFIDNLKQLKFVAPQGRYAKVTYRW